MRTKYKMVIKKDILREAYLITIIKQYILFTVRLKKALHIN